MERWEQLVGDWTGTNRLWLHPGAPERTSDTTATIALEGRGKFASVRYTWSDDGKPCEGLLLARRVDEPGTALVWLDSWHMSDKFMTLDTEAEAEAEAEAAVGGDAIVVARGSYEAPPGPPWGWRIGVHVGANDTWSLVMHNITPDSQEAKAVEATYARLT